MTECDEVAATILPGWVGTYWEALKLVREQMPDETETNISNVAWALYRRSESQDLAAIPARKVQP